MNLNKNDYLFFIKNYKFTVPVVITLLIGYAFTLTNPSVGIDDLSFDRYLYGELFAQGRMTVTIMQRTLALNSFGPFVLDFLAVLCLFFAAVVFCALFKRASNDSLHFYSYVFFACLLVSYPLICEIFVYMGTGLAVCFGYLMAAFAIMFVFNWMKDHKMRDFFLSVACIIIIASGYESLICVYICGVFTLMLLRLLFTDDLKYKKLKPNLIEGLKTAIPLALGIVLESIISKSLMFVLKLTPSTHGQNFIYYFVKGYTVPFLLKKAVVEIAFRYGFMSLVYLPITILNIAGIIAIIMMVYYGIKRKSITAVLLFFGILFSLIILTIIQGAATPYRACQIFGFFAAFIFMLALQGVMKSKRKMSFKRAFLILACLLVFYQASSLNKWFYTDYLRYKDDVNAVNMIAGQLISGYDFEHKPIVFTGAYKEPAKIVQLTSLSHDSFQFRLFRDIDTKLGYPAEKYLGIGNTIYISEVIGRSYITWGVSAFSEANTELFKFLSYEGYDFKQGTKEMYKEAKKIAPALKSWPQKGSIVDMGKYILVNFGEK
jgi:hypothetical protein